MKIIKHKQILDRLMAKPVKILEGEIKELLFLVKCNYFESDQVVPRLAKRWGKVFDGDESVCSINYSRQINLALATILHQYGLCNKALAQKAIDCIDALNNDVVLDDTFYRNSDAMKALLLSTPEKVKKLPAGTGKVESVTFLREKDLITIRFNDLWFVFYVDQVKGFNETPIIIFYDCVFDKKPTPEEVIGHKATSRIRNSLTTDTVIDRYWSSDLSYLPDPAGQYELLASNWEHRPDVSHIDDLEDKSAISNRILEFERATTKIVERHKK